MRTGLLLAVTVALGLAAQASAKDGAQARLLAPIPANATVGAVITVKWTVDRPGPNGKPVPFSATGMFVRLIGPDGTSTIAVAPQAYGPVYSARVRVPSGGIRSIELGLRGWAVTPTGTRPAPELFHVASS